MIISTSKCVVHPRWLDLGPEELQRWAKVLKSVQRLVDPKTMRTASERVLGVNRLIAEFPTDEQMEAGEGYKVLKPIRTRFQQGLEEIKLSAENEVR
jgi:hypothetical protein